MTLSTEKVSREAVLQNQPSEVFNIFRCLKLPDPVPVPRKITMIGRLMNPLLIGRFGSENS